MNKSEQNILATSYIGRRGGVAHIGIDFENQIYGFPNYVISDLDDYRTLFFSDECEIVCDYARMSSRGNWYAASRIWVILQNEEEQLLEDYAYDFILQATASERIFESKDFLTQLCITHTILFLQKYATAKEPYNRKTREMHERWEKLHTAFLGLFEAKIQEVSTFTSKKWEGSIDFYDIYARALQILSSLICGDNKKIVGGVVDKYRQSPSRSSAKLKSLDRELRIHPFATRSGYDKTDIKKTYDQNMSQLNKLFLAHCAANSPIAEDLLLLMVDKDARAEFIAGSLNNDSNRIYRPSSWVSVKEFVFGTKTSRSKIMRYLSDGFRTERTRVRKNIRNYSDDYDYRGASVRGLSTLKRERGERMEIETGQNAVRRWKKNDVTRLTLSQKELLREEANQKLKGKQLKVTLKFLSGNYNPTNSTERKNLSRAREKVPRLKL